MLGEWKNATAAAEMPIQSQSRDYAAKYVEVRISLGIN